MYKIVGAGDLSERITFVVATKVDDGYSTNNVYADGDTVYANARFVSDREKFVANSIQETIDVRFIIRKREVKRDWRIRHNGIVYNITGVRPLDRAFIEITCGEIPNGS